MTAKLTKIKSALRETIRLADEATPGPWLPSVYGYQVLTGDSWNTVCVFHEGYGTHRKDHRLSSWEDGRAASTIEANSTFIAHARTFALAQAKALLAAIEGMEEVQEKSRNWGLSLIAAKRTLQTISNQWPK